MLASDLSGCRLADSIAKNGLSLVINYSHWLNYQHLLTLYNINIPLHTKLIGIQFRAVGGKLSGTKGYYSLAWKLSMAPQSMQHAELHLNFPGLLGPCDPPMLTSCFPLPALSASYLRSYRLDLLCKFSMPPLGMDSPSLFT